MGLFGKSESCSICGGKVGKLTSVKVSDGVVCANCCARCGSGAMIGFLSVDAVKEHIGLRERNLERYGKLKPTSAVADYIQVYSSEQVWCSPASGDKKRPDFFRFGDIIEYELLEDGASITKGGLGSAIVGGAFAGGVGAIVGVGLGKKQKDVVNNLSIRVSTRCTVIPHVEINFINTETKRGGFLYKANKELAMQTISILDQIVASAGHDQATPAQAASSADEILKFKQLLDAGAITQDEYDAKKKQLLGL